MSDNKETKDPPKDSYHQVYLIFYWLGMGSLLPWNFFISVNNYWMYKYRDVDTISNSTLSNDTEKMTDLQIAWNSYLSMASMIPNVAFLKLNAIFGHHFPTEPRLIFSQIVIMLMCLFTGIMALVDTDQWQSGFLYLTLASVVVINIMVAVYQGGLSGLAAFFPSKYMGSVVQGQALGGIFAAVTNVLCLAMGADSKWAAFACFIVNVGFLALALMAFVFVHKTNFFKFYYEGKKYEPNPDSETKDNPEELQLVNNDADQPTTQVQIQPKINVLAIGKTIWVWILTAFLTYMVTLACFPSITSLVQSTASNDVWSQKYFIPVGCFLLFNIGDYLGRILSGLIQWPNDKTPGGCWIVLTVSVIRIVFIPLFLLCNASPHNRYYTKVYFPSDIVYMTFISLFSISCGYLGSTCMMFAPKMLPSGQAQATAASIMVSFLVFGLAVGAGFSSITIMLL